MARLDEEMTLEYSTETAAFRFRKGSAHGLVVLSMGSYSEHVPDPESYSRLLDGEKGPECRLCVQAHNLVKDGELTLQHGSAKVCPATALC